MATVYESRGGYCRHLTTNSGIHFLERIVKSRLRRGHCLMRRLESRRARRELVSRQLARPTHKSMIVPSEFVREVVLATTHPTRRTLASQRAIGFVLVSIIAIHACQTSDRETIELGHVVHQPPAPSLVLLQVVAQPFDHLHLHPPSCLLRS